MNQNHKRDEEIAKILVKLNQQSVKQQNSKTAKQQSKANKLLSNDSHKKAATPNKSKQNKTKTKILHHQQQNQKTLENSGKFNKIVKTKNATATIPTAQIPDLSVTDEK